MTDTLYACPVKEETREGLFTRLYLEGFPAVARHISRSGGNLEEARDIFQETLLVYYERVVIAGFQPEKVHKAYLLGIAKNMWLKKCRKGSHTEPLDDLDIAEPASEQVRTEKLLSFLKQTGEKCMDLLQSFYYEKLSMEILSKRFGFKSERSATVQKYKCLEKMRDQVKQKSLTYEDFTA